MIYEPYIIIERTAQDKEAQSSLKAVSGTMAARENEAVFVWRKSDGVY